MRPRRLAAAVAVLVVLSACAPLHLSPAGRAAFTANQVVIRLGELQDAAIAANRSGDLADGPAIMVVRFSVDGAKIAKASPDGWLANLKVSWTVLLERLDATTKARLRVTISAVNALLGA